MARWTPLLGSGTLWGSSLYWEWMAYDIGTMNPLEAIIEDIRHVIPDPSGTGSRNPGLGGGRGRANSGGVRSDMNQACAQEDASAEPSLQVSELALADKAISCGQLE